MSPFPSRPQELSGWFVSEVHRDFDIHLCHLSCWLWSARCPQAKMRWQTCSRTLKVETSEVLQTLSSAFPARQTDWAVCPLHRLFTLFISVFSVTATSCIHCQYLTLSEHHEAVCVQMWKTNDSVSCPEVSEVCAAMYLTTFWFNMALQTRAYKINESSHCGMPPPPCSPVYSRTEY